LMALAKQEKTSGRFSRWKGSLTSCSVKPSHLAPRIGLISLCVKTSKTSCESLGFAVLWNTLVHGAVQLVPENWGTRKVGAVTLISTCSSCGKSLCIIRAIVGDYKMYLLIYTEQTGRLGWYPSWKYMQFGKIPSCACVLFSVQMGRHGATYKLHCYLMVLFVQLE
jgi:hypothetical protein